MTELHCSELIVDHTAIRRNLAVLRDHVAPAELMLVVKADAYGHGLREVAATGLAAAVPWLGVLTVPNGLLLRSLWFSDEVPTTQQPRLFAWLLDPDDDLEHAVAGGIELGVSTIEQIARIRAAASAVGRLARVHLKFDSGLARDGATAAEWPELVAAAVAGQDEGDLALVAAWSHLAEASEDEDALARKRYLDTVRAAEEAGARFELRHLAASSASWLRPDFRLDLVRIGAHAYGIPVPEGLAARDMGLVPALSLRSRVTEVRDGVATVPLGWLDGLPAGRLDGAAVGIAGQRYPVRPGSMAAAEFQVDLPAGARVAAGDEVWVFGAGIHGEPTVNEWADAAGTIGEELVCRIGVRLPRRHIGGDA